MAKIDNLQWARDVLLVYHCLDDTSSEMKGTMSKGATEIWKWATNPENREKFLGNWMIKATELLQKHDESQEDDGIASHEEKSVEFLREVLREEVEKSRMSPVT